MGLIQFYLKKRLFTFRATDIGKIEVIIFREEGLLNIDKTRNWNDS